MAEAIDFFRLLREEKRRARHRGDRESEKKSPNVSTPRTATATVIDRPLVLPPWTYATRLTLLPRLDHTVHCLSQANPSYIYYIPDYLPADFQQALMQWLLQLSETTTAPKSSDDPAVLSRWTALPHAKRRVAVFQQSTATTTETTKIVHDNQDSSLTSQTSFPKPLSHLVDALMQSHVFLRDEEEDASGSRSRSLNHILVNHYDSGTLGILPHTDGPAYAPCTVIVSLGSDTLMDFVPSVRCFGPGDNGAATTATKQVWLRPGSLLIFSHAAYQDYLHGIADLKSTTTATTSSSGMEENQSDDGPLVQVAGAGCLNAPAGMRITRGPRVSLTIRHKFGL